MDHCDQRRQRYRDLERGLCRAKDHIARAAGELAEILRDPQRAVSGARDLAHREFALGVAISRYSTER